MKWAVWCEFKDGRKNGAWAGEDYDGLRTYRSDCDAATEVFRKKAKFPHGHFEVREYTGDE
jgi:hypothetical protein